LEPQILGATAHLISQDICTLAKKHQQVNQKALTNTCVIHFYQNAHSMNLSEYYQILGRQRNESVQAGNSYLARYSQLPSVRNSL